MKWYVFFFLSVAVIAAAGILAARIAAGKYKRGRVLTPINVLFGGLFISVLLGMCPVDAGRLGGVSGFWDALRVVMFSLHNTFQIFTIDADKDLILNDVLCKGVLHTAYTALLSVEFVLGPLLTFGFVVSFFKNAFVYWRYLFHRFGSVYVFSELNEKSIALAQDLRARHPRAVIAFTDVFEKNDELNYELAERARELNAICFKKDILSVNFRRHDPDGEIFFFAIGSDEIENIDQALRLIEFYADRKNTRLYVFSTRIESELMLAQAAAGEIKVRRVNEVQSLVYRELYENGARIFETARPAESGEKEIGALVIGMGGHGTEMIKALAWYCQMDGYRVTVDAFDSDPLAADRFTAQCPELMSPEYNGVFVNGEAQYTICLHPGVSVSTKTFEEAVRAIGNVTYVMISLGSDERNIRTAVELRVLFERMHIHPVIRAIVYNTHEKNALTGIVNFRGQAYDIDFIGDLATSFSEACVIDSALEAEALRRHLKWGDEEDFWRYEYNYRSSVASAIHLRARAACGIPGATKKEEDVTPEEQLGIETLEHRRWNAYMRAEGYVYSGSPEKSSRNDLGKMHHDLVNYDDLTEEEKRKDLRVGTD